MDCHRWLSAPQSRTRRRAPGRAIDEALAVGVQQDELSADCHGLGPQGGVSGEWYSDTRVL